MTHAEQFLKSLPLFEKCLEEDIQRFALNLRWHSYKAGETVLFQGMISHQMFLVVAGRCAVFVRKDRETLRLAELGAGQYFGEISLLTNKAATATVKADADGTEVYALDRDVVVDALSRHPDILADVTRKVQERNQNRLEAFQQGEEAAAASA